MTNKPIWERKTTWTGVAIIAAAVVPAEYRATALAVLNGLAIIFLRMGIEEARREAVNGKPKP